MKETIANTCRWAHMHIRKINSIRRYLCEDSTKPLKYYITILLSIFVNCFNGIPQQELSDLHLPHLLCHAAEVEQFDMADDFFFEKMIYEDY